MGTFWKRKEEVDKCNWSCMFGEEEVPAQVLSDGTLRCYAPPHKPGRVPFDITCSNRIACSEVGEFEFREPSPFRSDMETSELSAVNSINEMHLYIRLEKLLAVEPVSDFVQKPNVSELCNKITALLVDDDEWSDLLQLTDGRNRLVEKLMKERLHSWLIRKVSEEGKGPNVLGQEGQGVIHLAAALGYEANSSRWCQCEFEGCPWLDSTSLGCILWQVLFFGHICIYIFGKISFKKSKKNQGQVSRNSSK